MDSQVPRKDLLLTGATGYIGGLLLDRLIRDGHRVRCLSRRPQAIRKQAEAVRGDVLDPESLAAALKGIDTAYYLVHSMKAGPAWAETDRRGARNFACACQRSGIRRIIYLGGLGGIDQLSEHLKSRQEVGDILRSSGVATIEFRAAVVIGAGSLSFEMIRALVERLPVMITPRWVRTPTQPIAVDDVIEYLASALTLPGDQSRVLEIGGARPTSYLGMMREYARQRGLRRLFIPVPLLTPTLSSLWLKLVTPLFARVGRELIEGVRNPTVVTRDEARRLFPLAPMDLSQAVARAMQPSGMLKIDSRQIKVFQEAGRAFQPVQQIGGQRGWYYANWLWKLRGLIDRMFGGPGMRPGRRDPQELIQGDPLDFWTVEKIEAHRLLRLRAKMKLPGTAWLEFEVLPEDQGAIIRQTASFDPRGVWGRIYWYLLLPIHKLIFRGLLKRIASFAGRTRQDPQNPPA